MGSRRGRPCARRPALEARNRSGRPNKTGPAWRGPTHHSQTAAGPRRGATPPRATKPFLVSPTDVVLEGALRLDEARVARVAERDLHAGVGARAVRRRRGRVAAVRSESRRGRTLWNWRRRHHHTNAPRDIDHQPPAPVAGRARAAHARPSTRRPGVDEVAGPLALAAARLDVDGYDGSAGPWWRRRGDGPSQPNRLQTVLRRLRDRRGRELTFTEEAAQLPRPRSAPRRRRLRWWRRPSACTYFSPGDRHMDALRVGAADAHSYVINNPSGSDFESRRLFLPAARRRSRLIFLSSCCTRTAGSGGARDFDGLHCDWFFLHGLGCWAWASVPGCYCSVSSAAMPPRRRRLALRVV